MTKGHNTIITVLAQAWIWVILFVLTQVSCTQDKEYADTGVTLYPAISTDIENEISTRATMNVRETSKSYDDALIQNGTVIRVFAAPTSNDTEKRVAGSFRYNNNKWRSSVTAENNEEYCIFAITPSLLPGASSQEFNWGVTNNVFNQDNATLTFTNLDIITDSDPMANIAAAGRTAQLNNAGQEVDAQDNVIADSEVPTITRGEFNIGTVDADVSNNKVYKVWMAMDHLFAKATISFCVDEKYDEIREIRIKSARITVANGLLKGNHSYNFRTGLSLNPDQNTPFTEKALSIDLLYGPTATDNRTVSSDYVVLTTDYKEYGWFCFLPVSYLHDLEYPQARLQVTYDVYDKAGHVVRLGQTVSNSFPLDVFKRTDDALISPQPADHFKVKVKVKPTYVLQLIDDDAEMTLEIINDTN